VTFLEIYKVCLRHEADPTKEKASCYKCVDHFVHAVNSIDWEDFTDRLDKIINQLPKLSTSFKTYFAAEAWILTSVQLQKSQGTWNPSFQISLPSK